MRAPLAIMAADVKPTAGDGRHISPSRKRRILRRLRERLEHAKAMPATEEAWQKTMDERAKCAKELPETIEVPQKTNGEGEVLQKHVVMEPLITSIDALCTAIATLTGVIGELRNQLKKPEAENGKLEETEKEEDGAGVETEGIEDLQKVTLTGPEKNGDMTDPDQVVEALKPVRAAEVLEPMMVGVSELKKLQTVTEEEEEVEKEKLLEDIEGEAKHEAAKVLEKNNGIEVLQKNKDMEGIEEPEELKKLNYTAEHAKEEEPEHVISAARAEDAAAEAITTVDAEEAVWGVGDECRHGSAHNDQSIDSDFTEENAFKLLPYGTVVPAGLIGIGDVAFIEAHTRIHVQVLAALRRRGFDPEVTSLARFVWDAWGIANREDRWSQAAAALEESMVEVLVDQLSNILIAERNTVALQAAQTSCPDNSRKRKPKKRRG